MGERGAAVLAANRGAVSRIVRELRDFLGVG
jgi:hypothetical protein